MRIRLNDTVKVLYGKDAGKRGRVVKVYPEKRMVVVEGVNMYKRHVKGDGRGRQSEIVSLLKPMPVSKVQLIDPATGMPTRVRFEVIDGVKTRVSVKTGKPLGVEKKPGTDKNETGGESVKDGKKSAPKKGKVAKDKKDKK